MIDSKYAKDLMMQMNFLNEIDKLKSIGITKINLNSMSEGEKL